MLSIHRKSLTFEVLKMLTESLILSRIDYALLWGPPLNKSQVAQLQCLQNRDNRITRCLRKYDHVTLHLRQLNWLSISLQIMFKPSCAMYCHYHYDKKPVCSLNLPLFLELSTIITQDAKTVLQIQPVFIYQPPKNTSALLLQLGGIH